MAIDQELYPTGSDEQAVAALGMTPFEELMVARVVHDFEKAEQFRRLDQQRVSDYDHQYHNALYYQELSDHKEFPVPIGQQTCDSLKAHLSDKLFYAGRPCRIVGVEESDAPDADSRQLFMDWLDYRDNIKGKIGQALLDCAIRKMAVAMVDYVETSKDIWAEQVIEGADPTTGEATQELQWVKNTVKDYIGAVVKMVDPQDLYFGPDKKTLDDPFPLMVHSTQALGYFYSKKYFRNQGLIPEKAGDSSTPDRNAEFKREFLDNPEARSTTAKPYSYIEWEGPINKRELYEFSKLPFEDVAPDDMTWAICGVVDKQTVVRLEELPHGIQRPNIIIGNIQNDGSIFRPVSIMEKIYGICREADKALGMLMTNIEQNIDSMWIINVGALANKNPVVNNRGAILESNRPPDEVAQRIEQIPLTEPLSGLLVQFYQMARDASGIQLISSGQADPGAETLGESNLIEANAGIGINDYLRMFEQTFVQPLYELRNEINGELLDDESAQDFKFRVLGDQASEWRPIDPGAIKARVDFVCEASTRESNRAVITQQMLKWLEMAPQLIANGYPVRLDLLGKLVMESGMTISQETIKELLPTLKVEESLGIDLSTLLGQTALIQMGINAQMLQGTAGAIGMAGQPGEQPGGPALQQPMTETDAVQSANAENQVNVAKPV